MQVEEFNLTVYTYELLAAGHPLRLMHEELQALEYTLNNLKWAQISMPDIADSFTTKIERVTIQRDAIANGIRNNEAANGSLHEQLANGSVPNRWEHL